MHGTGVNQNEKDCFSIHTTKNDTKKENTKNAHFFRLLVLSKKNFFLQKRKKYLDQTADVESNSLSHHNFQVDCKNVKKKFKMQFLFEEYVKVDFFAKDKREEFHCNLCKHSKLEF